MKCGNGVSVCCYCWNSLPFFLYADNSFSISFLSFHGGLRIVRIVEGEAKCSLSLNILLIQSCVFLFVYVAKMSSSHMFMWGKFDFYILLVLDFPFYLGSPKTTLLVQFSTEGLWWCHCIERKGNQMVLQIFSFVLSWFTSYFPCWLVCLLLQVLFACIGGRSQSGVADLLQASPCCLVNSFIVITCNICILYLGLGFESLTLLLMYIYTWLFNCNWIISHS